MFRFGPGKQGRMNLADGMMGHLHSRKRTLYCEDQFLNRFQGGSLSFQITWLNKLSASIDYLKGFVKSAWRQAGTQASHNFGVK